MKKLIILAFILPSLVLGQRLFQSAENGWSKDLLAYRKANNLPLERDSQLDSLAKERFFAIANFLKNKDLGYIKFMHEFGSGEHGIESMGLQNFDNFIKNKFKNVNHQEICCFVPNYGIRKEDHMLGVINSPANGGIINLYKSSQAHWEVVSSNIEVNQITKYNGRVEKRKVIKHNNKFGSFTGILYYDDVDPLDPSKRIKSTIVINVSIFEGQ